MITHYKYRPLFYYSLTFLTTYVFWFVGAYMSAQEHLKDAFMLVILPGLMAPFLISLVMILTSKNAALKKDFVNRLINPTLINLKALPIFVCIMPLAVLLSITLSLFFGGSAEQFRFAEGFSFSAGSIPVLIVLLLAAAFEELGWRGYAFDSLQSRYNYFSASLIFSVLWSAWHFPLVFVKGFYQYEILHQNFWYAVNFFVGIVPMGIIISWICLKHRKSVLAAITFHFFVNIWQELLNMTQATKCIETVVLAAIAALIVASDKDLFFSKTHLIGEARL